MRSSLLRAASSVSDVKFIDLAINGTLVRKCRKHLKSSSEYRLTHVASKDVESL